MAKTTDELIDLVKDAVPDAINRDVYEAEVLAKTLEVLVSTKRIEQFIENEKENE